ncbi:MAG: slipin family protein [Clostridia bacterium]|nr:MAG: slipin family protein [Clostridia bacterium]
MSEAEGRENGTFSTSVAAFSVTVAAGLGGLILVGVGAVRLQISLVIAGLVIAIWCLAAVKVARQWEKAVILRLGRIHRTVGPGPFIIIPLLESVAAWVDQRIRTSSFNAEQTLTKDNVPVDVDAILFWMVWDAEKAVLEVADYEAAVSWASQTALREVIGRTLLSDMLAAREQIDEELQTIIDARTEPWGIAVQAVEIRDVIIPANLQEAMSREAQAERERRARIILGGAEVEIASKFAEAARSYQNDEVALNLRAMNLLYEGLKEKGSLVVVPSRAVESLGAGGILGMASLARESLAGTSGVGQHGESEPSGVPESLRPAGSRQIEGK